MSAREITSRNYSLRAGVETSYFAQFTSARRDKTVLSRRVVARCEVGISEIYKSAVLRSPVKDSKVTV